MDKVRLASFKLTGLKLDKKTTNHDGQSSVDCGSLWQQFEKEHIAEQIPDKISEEVYAVYFDYEGDQTEPFSYFIGCKVQSGIEPPKGMQTLTIPEQDYHKILAKGQTPDCISDAWENIWDSQTERAFNYDFEVYDQRSNDWNNAEVDIFVSVNDRD